VDFGVLGRHPPVFHRAKLGQERIDIVGHRVNHVLRAKFFFGQFKGLDAARFLVEVSQRVEVLVE